jgi:SAM-dependent methyltransferase
VDSRPQQDRPRQGRPQQGRPEHSRPLDTQREDGKPWQQRWDERYTATEFDPDRAPSEFVVAELGGLPPGRALDLGAGSGRHTAWLAQRGWRVTAVDFSQAGLALARRLSVVRGVDQARVDWVVADLGEYQPERNAYDLAMISYVQPSSAVRAAILSRIPAALVPGGTAFVLGFDLANLTEGTGRTSDPDVLYSLEAVSAELSGLRIVRAERLYYGIERDDGPVTTVATLVRAVRD